MILQFYVKRFYTAINHRHNRYRFYALNVNQRLQAIGSTEVVVTEGEATFIDSLRGLNGSRAKRQAFKYAIEQLGVTYDALVKAFPNCSTTQ